MTSIPITLTIAGSDSGGGAGIQADLKAFHAFGTFGTSVITALTAQNTLGVSGVHSVPPEFVRAQLEAVATDLRPAALKTGMLATAEVVEAVADGIREFGLENVVADPVMIATSGDRLLDAGAEHAISTRLLPLVALVTPNLDEAALLVGEPVDTVPAMERAARALVQQGARAALVKGGHLEGEEVVDVLFDGGERATGLDQVVQFVGALGGDVRDPAADHQAAIGILGIGDRDDRVVERALDVRHPVGDVLALATAGASAPGLGLRHYLRTFFLPATVFLGPLRVRALVWVRWPRTGRPLRWRRPR